MGPSYGGYGQVGGGMYGQTGGGGSILGVRACGTPTCTSNGSQVRYVNFRVKYIFNGIESTFLALYLLSLSLSLILL